LPPKLSGAGKTLQLGCQVPCAEQSSTDTHQIAGISAGSTDDGEAGIGNGEEDEDAHDYKNTGPTRQEELSAMPSYLPPNAADGEQDLYANPGQLDLVRAKSTVIFEE
jgi:hypothetical protein